MNKIIISVFIIIFFVILVYSQVGYFSDGFENGINWDENVGVVRSTEHAHSGIYSAMWEVTELGSKKIVKYNSQVSYSKIAFYLYVTNWSEGNCAIEVGGNGLQWMVQFTRSTWFHVYDCQHVRSPDPFTYLPLDQWVYIEIEKDSFGYLLVKTNGYLWPQWFVGTCSYTDITFAF